MEEALKAKLDLSALDLVYDEEADVLYISFGPDRKAEESILTDNDIIIRYKHGEIIGLTVLHFSERVKKAEKRRSPMQIVADILSVADEGASITQIVYKANLNFSRAAKYLEMLLKRGYIRTIKEPGSTRIVYQTTDEGKRFLMQYRQMKELASGV